MIPVWMSLLCFAILCYYCTTMCLFLCCSNWPKQKQISCHVSTETDALFRVPHVYSEYGGCGCDCGFQQLLQRQEPQKGLRWVLSSWGEASVVAVVDQLGQHFFYFFVFNFYFGSVCIHNRANIWNHLLCSMKPYLNVERNSERKVS